MAGRTFGVHTSNRVFVVCGGVRARNVKGKSRKRSEADHFDTSADFTDAR
jgi:hypothetical protein